MLISYKSVASSLGAELKRPIQACLSTIANLSTALKDAKYKLQEVTADTIRFNRQIATAQKKLDHMNPLKDLFSEEILTTKDTAKNIKEKLAVAEGQVDKEKQRLDSIMKKTAVLMVPTYHKIMNEGCRRLNVEPPSQHLLAAMCCMDVDGNLTDFVMEVENFNKRKIEDISKKTLDECFAEIVEESSRVDKRPRNGNGDGNILRNCRDDDDKLFLDMDKKLQNAGM